MCPNFRPSGENKFRKLHKIRWKGGANIFSTSAEYTAGCLGAAGHQRGWCRSEGSPPLHVASHVRALSCKVKRKRQSVTGGAPDAAPTPAHPQAEQADGGDRGDHDEDQPNRTEDTARQNKTEANEAEQEPGRTPKKRLKTTGRRDQGAAALKGEMKSTKKRNR